MSFIGIRTYDASPFARQFHFLRMLLDTGLNSDFESSSDKMSEVRTVLREFKLGLLNYPYKDEGQNGMTVVYKLPEGTVDNGRYAPRDFEGERFCVFTSTSTLMDFFNDYFGLEDAEVTSLRTMRKKYRSAFAFESLEQNEISDFATLAMRVARDILTHQELFNTDDGRFVYTRISQKWNHTETIVVKNAIEAIALDAYF